MANKIATLLGNTKTRTLVLIVFGVLIFGVVIAVSQTDSESKGPEAAAPSKTTAVPNQVQSTPGSAVTRKYQELQEKANIRGAQEAAEKGTTFIPTLTGNVEGLSDQDFEQQLTSAYSELGSKCSKQAVEKYRQKGLNTTEIILQLKADGCSAEQISALFTCDQIATALLAEDSCGATGCTPAAVQRLKDQGKSEAAIVADLKANGCSTNEIVASLKETGSNTEQIVAALKENGYDAAQIAAALKANGATIDEITRALKENGYDATEIANALSKAGFEKNEIVAALTKSGFSAVEVAKALSALNAENNQPNTNNAQLAEQAAAARRLRAQQEAQQLAAFSQQRQGKIQELVSAMDVQRKSAMDTWTQIPQQLFTQGEWASMKAQMAAQNAQNGGNGNAANGGLGNIDEENKGVILKAGSILFAVLDTAVNSDEPGPVMATIVSGSLKGAKLLGSMSSNLTSETISLNFSAINMPNEANSMGISAVAIDPDTARTALASDVDHHYLFRWGSLFASSFVQGYAQAVANSGSTSTTSQGAAGVTTTTSSPPLDGRQQLFAGIAEVGQKWSEVVGQNFNRPITVTIDQGTGIGVLVTSDLTFGTNPIFYTPPTTSAAAATPATPPAAEGSTSNIPGALGNGTTLTADERQALWNILQNQPVTTQAAGSSTVTTTSTMGGTP